MKQSALLLFALAVMLTACERDAGPPVVITDVRILAPMPGSSMGVAYLTIENRGSETIVVLEASSPQFNRVEMHETTIEDGVSRMRPLDEVPIDSGSSVEFRPGGKHLMLMSAKADAVPGAPVTLEIQHNDGLLIVSATMQARLPAE